MKLSHFFDGDDRIRSGRDIHVRFLRQNGGHHLTNNGGVVYDQYIDGPAGFFIFSFLAAKTISRVGHFSSGRSEGGWSAPSFSEEIPFPSLLSPRDWLITAVCFLGASISERLISSMTERILSTLRIRKNFFPTFPKPFRESVSILEFNDGGGCISWEESVITLLTRSARTPMTIFSPSCSTS